MGGEWLCVYFNCNFEKKEIVVFSLCAPYDECVR